jgi:NADH dehydrogenase [ubiquinone] 1 alpha subcomplex assembly factor 7
MLRRLLGTACLRQTGTRRLLSDTYRPHQESSKRFEDWLDRVSTKLTEEEVDDIEASLPQQQEKALKRNPNEKPLFEKNDHLKNEVEGESGFFRLDNRDVRERYEKMNGLEQADVPPVIQEPMSFEFARLDSGESPVHDLRYIENPLQRLMVRTILNTGPMSVRDFMRMALTDPHYGYYTTKKHVIGSEGDFITSPEISPAFGEMIAIWCIESWKNMGSPEKLNIVELGPGKGTLAHSILLAAKQIAPDFCESVTFNFIEASDVLQGMQKEKVDSLKININASWYKSMELFPRKIGPTIFIAHEFFDAMPVYQFIYVEGKGWHEVIVDWDDNEKKFVLGMNQTVAAALMNSSLPKDAVHNQRHELCPDGVRVAVDIGKRIIEDDGALLMIDYGPDSQNPQDSIRGIQNHKFVPFYENPGNIDVTADVDFKAFGELFEQMGLQFKIDNQSNFLLSLGIAARFDKLIKSVPSKDLKWALYETLERLVGTKEGCMGQVYKAMVISKPPSV